MRNVDREERPRHTVGIGSTKEGSHTVPETTQRMEQEDGPLDLYNG